MNEPTEPEMSEVLLEFHQRNQGLVKPPGPPPPFEIGVAVQPFPTVVQEQRQQEAPPLITPDSAVVRKETEIDFEMVQIIPWQPGQRWGTFAIGFYMRCHNEGSVSEPCYIRTYNSYWTPASQGNTRCTPPVPVIGGPSAVSFNGSSWTPTQENQYIEARFIFLNFPQCEIITNILGWHYCSFWMQQISDGTELDVIYGSGYIPNWTWGYPTGDPGVLQSQNYIYF